MTGSGPAGRRRLGVPGLLRRGPPRLGGDRRTGHGRKSILIGSQILVGPWPGVIGEPMIVDAVLDRIVHNGKFQRKRNKPSPVDGPTTRRPRPDGQGPGAPCRTATTGRAAAC